MSALNLLLLDDVQCWPHYVEPWHSLMAPYSPSLLFNQPASPTETCTSFASSSSGSLERQPTHVVCNAPLVAPIPLPFHSPTFLQFELLPDIDEDLSHPPYTTRKAEAECPASASDTQLDPGEHAPSIIRGTLSPNSESVAGFSCISLVLHTRPTSPPHGRPAPKPSGLLAWDL
ncbi:hypothetical protein C8F01DRAFT_1242510 [Mycena amicta]|nr:hypothetical protein C8F01DRAFT_1242510 [Mycena amicta]